MNIFISGATGFIGEHLSLKLANEGHTVHALYRSLSKTKNLQHPNIRLFHGDIIDVESLEKAMNGCEQAYHVAAYAAAWEDNPGDFVKFNVQGTLNVIDTAKKAGVKKTVVTSTAGIFGPSLNGTITEKSVSPLPHFTGYERSKAESERLIADRVQKGQHIVIVNPTRVFGPGVLNESNSVTIMIHKYIQGKWKFLPGDGRSLGNYVFVHDVVQGHMLAMEKGRAGERYILGGSNVSYIEFFEEVKRQSGKGFSLMKVPLPLMLAVGHTFIGLNKLFKVRPKITPAHVQKFNYNWEVSSEKAEKELGYRVTPFGKAINETIITLRTTEI